MCCIGIDVIVFDSVYHGVDKTCDLIIATSLTGENQLFRIPPPCWHGYMGGWM